MKAPDQARENWLDEIVSLTEAAALRTISIDTLRAEIRAGRLRDIKLSARRRGMTRREALRDSRGVR